MLAAPALPDAVVFLRKFRILKPAMIVFFTLPVAYVIVYLVSQARVTRIRAYLFLMAVCLIGVVLTAPERETPEHIHLLIYSLLAVISYKAFSFTLKDLASYAIPLVVTVFVGYLDEVWQGTMPGRRCDFRDVSDNAVGALIGMSFMFIRQRYGGKLVKPVSSGVLDGS